MKLTFKVVELYHFKNQAELHSFNNIEFATIRGLANSKDD